MSNVLTPEDYKTIEMLLANKTQAIGASISEHMRYALTDSELYGAEIVAIDAQMCEALNVQYDFLERLIDRLRNTIVAATKAFPYTDGNDGEDD